MKPVIPPPQRQQEQALIAPPIRARISRPAPAIARGWLPVTVFSTPDSGLRSADVLAMHVDLEQKSSSLSPYLLPTR